MSKLETVSFEFAISCVNLSKSLVQKQEYILSRQVLRSGTAIGALIAEAKFGESKADFRHKLSIALKEAHETHYWLKLLHATTYLSEEEFGMLAERCDYLIAMLVKSIKTLKQTAMH
jgi:four helix bundle protein